MERGLSIFNVCVGQIYEHIGGSSEPEMSNLTHDDDTVRAYSQNILQEVLLLTKHIATVCV